MVQRGKSPDKRARIVAAAVKVFAAKGFYCARVSDVAREAGVADGTIYLYFDSKEELLRGLYEENMRRIIDGLSTVVSSEGTPCARLSRVFEAYTEFALEQPDLAEVLTVEIRESGKFMNEFAAPLFGQFLRQIVGVVIEGQQCGEFRPEFSARNITRAMFGALDEIALAWIMSGRKFDLRQSGQEVLDVFLAGMRTPSVS
jgi:TetR/AcrR family fatty acid metabolism transcriptional regulator